MEPINPQYLSMEGMQANAAEYRRQEAECLENAKDWTQRAAIARGAAMACEHLLNECYPAFVPVVEDAGGEGSECPILTVSADPDYEFVGIGREGSNLDWFLKNGWKELDVSRAEGQELNLIYPDGSIHDIGEHQVALCRRRVDRGMPLAVEEGGEPEA